MPNDTIGIKELAEIAGVSIATVSRAISNPKRVSKATREKVLDAVKKTGYSPNRLGASLRTAKTGNIIAIMPDVSDQFNFGVIKSLELEASKRGYSVLLGDTQGDRARELAYGAIVRSKQADGIILFSHRLPYDIDVDAFDANNFPPIVNSCETSGLPGLPLVSINNRAAGEEATNYLIGLGHKKIAVITGSTESPSAVERLKGYLAALKTIGINRDNDLIKYGNYTIESGEENTKQLLALTDRPSAIFCFSDEIAMGCLAALKNSGLKVPEDISVMGFDDIRFARFFDPPLTTIAQPVEEIGKHCISLLHEKLTDKDAKPEDVILPHKLVVRSSTGPVKPDE